MAKETEIQKADDKQLRKMHRHSSEMPEVRKQIEAELDNRNKGSIALMHIATMPREPKDD